MELLKSLLADPDVMAGIIEKYKPTLYKMAAEIYGIYKDYVDYPELSEYKAKAMMNDYQAFIKYGFTEDQAFTLLLNQQERNAEALRNMSKTSGANVTLKK